MASNRSRKSQSFETWRRIDAIARGAVLAREGIVAMPATRGVVPVRRPTLPPLDELELARRDPEARSAAPDRSDCADLPGRDRPVDGADADAERLGGLRCGQEGQLIRRARARRGARALEEIRLQPTDVPRLVLASVRREKGRS